MRVQSNLKRIVKFIINHRGDFFTSVFWGTAMRVFRERLNCFDRITNPEFLYTLQQIEKRPWNLHIENTNICNANCIFCAYQFQARTKTIMGKEIYSKALTDYCSIGGGEFRIETCVGDPLVDPSFIERIKEARSHAEIGKISTIINGINLGALGIEKLLKSGIDEINISTGPWDENLYQLMYRTKDYFKMRENVTELLRQNAKRGNPVRIKLLFRSNLSMKKTVGLPDYKAIRHLLHEIEFNTDFDTWLGTISQNNLLRGMHIRPSVKIDREPCYWLYDGPVIFSDGKIGLCGCRDFNADSELVIGNIMESSLLNLWQSDVVKRLRDRFRDGDFPKICRRCNAYANLDLYRSRKGLRRAELVSRLLNSKKN
jgi:MoaA/NifB/PqqE/SkfB family radical SAM enzyme